MSTKKTAASKPSKANDAQAKAKPVFKLSRGAKLATGGVVLAAVAILSIAALNPKLSDYAWLDPIRGAFAASHYDPFEEYTWHAMGSTWPGTIKFESEGNEVTLSPMGAPEIKGTYSYEIKHASSKNLRAAKLIEGTLRMTNTIGQVSESNFRMEDGDNLKLIYTSGQRPEEYARLTSTDVEAQKAQLEKMLREGTVKPFVPPAALTR